MSYPTSTISLPLCGVLATSFVNFIQPTLYIKILSSALRFNMRSLAIISLAALAIAGPLNPQVEEGNKALAALQDSSPDDAEAVKMVSEDQRQDQGVGEILSALGQNSPDVRIPCDDVSTTSTLTFDCRTRKPRRVLDAVTTTSPASSLPSKPRAPR